MKHESFQRFVADNFDRVRSYLRDGIYDRRTLWQEQSVRGVLGPNAGPAHPMPSDVGTCIPGRVYADADAFKICTAPGVLSELRPIGSDGEHFTYKGHDGATCEIIRRPDFDRPDVFSFFRCEHYTGFDATDDRIWDAFFGFFAAVLDASGRGCSADHDLAQAVMALNNEPGASPERFLVALGDQYMEYICRAYPGLGTPALNRAGHAGYNERVMLLHDLAAALPDEDDRRRALEVVQLMFLRKRLRNCESHGQQHIRDYSGMVRDFILDHVVLIYVIENVLNVRATRTDKRRKADIKAYYERVDVAANVAVYGNDGLTEGTRTWLRPFVAYRTSLTGAPANQVTLTDLRATGLTAVGRDGRVELCHDGMLQRLQQRDYNAMLAAALENDARLARKVKELESFLNGEVDILHRTRRSVILLWCSIVTVAVLAGLFIFAGNNRWAAMHSNICYQLSQRVFGFIDDGRYRWSYDRARYLTRQIGERQWRLPSDSSFTLFDLTEMNRLHPMRAKAAQCYRDAINAFRARVDSDPETHGDDAGDLALMLYRGQGGVYDPEGALRYAGIARRYGHNRRGLYAYLRYDDATPADLALIDSELPALARLTDDPYAPLIIAHRQFDREIRKAKPDNIVVLKALQTLDSLAGSESIAAEDAAIDIANMLLHGVTDDNGRFVFDTDPGHGMRVLLQLSLKSNETRSLIMLGQIQQNMGDLENAIELYAAAYYNGLDEAGSFALEVGRAMGLDAAEMERRWPLLKNMKGGLRWLDLLNEMQELANSAQYVSALVKLDEMRQTIPAEMQLHNDSDMHMSLLLNIPDSAQALRAYVRTLPLNPRLRWTADADSAARRQAVEDYLDAYYLANGLGDMPKNGPLAEAALRRASAAGLGYADISLARLIYDFDMYHRRAQEAFNIMGRATAWSDSARLWLAAKADFSDPQTARRLLSQVRDTTNLYKLVREFDNSRLEIMADTTTQWTRADILRHTRPLLNSICIADAIPPSVMAIYLSYVTGVYLGNTEPASYDLLYCLLGSDNLWPSAGLFTYPLYVAKIFAPDYGSQIDDFYREAAGVYLQTPVAQSSVYFRDRVNGVLANNPFYTSLFPEYPVRAWLDFEPEIPAFLGFEELFDGFSERGFSQFRKTFKPASRAEEYKFDELPGTRRYLVENNGIGIRLLPQLVRKEVQPILTRAQNRLAQFDEAFWDLGSILDNSAGDRFYIGGKCTETRLPDYVRRYFKEAGFDGEGDPDLSAVVMAAYAGDRAARRLVERLVYHSAERASAITGVFVGAFNPENGHVIFADEETGLPRILDFYSFLNNVPMGGILLEDYLRKVSDGNLTLPKITAGTSEERYLKLLYDNTYNKHFKR